MSGLSAAHTHTLFTFSLVYCLYSLQLLTSPVGSSVAASRGPFNHHNLPLQRQSLDKHLHSTGLYLVDVRENHDDITGWNVGGWQQAAVHYQRGRGAQEPLWEKVLMHSSFRTYETLGCKIWQRSLGSYRFGRCKTSLCIMLLKFRVKCSHLLLTSVLVSSIQV